MTNREKLISLLMEAMEEGEKECLSTANCPDCRAYEKYSRDECGLALSALHLIANGVVIREKGEWVRVKTDYGVKYECSRCKGHVDVNTYEDGTADEPPDFCPNCGADMRKENCYGYL